jgi:mono/diheme cytochrome c family protein
VARFIRDEKKTFPFMWLAAGGVFAASAFWAVYAEVVTRVPWQKDQQAFFDMELEQSRQALQLAKSEWEKELAPSLKDRLARKDELEQSKKSGAYKEAQTRLEQLNREYGDAELGKTFGSSDLDEAYYYRNLAEYDRDAASNEVRRAYRAAMAAEGPTKADAITDAIYVDPPRPQRGETSDAMYHLLSEVARAEAHVAQLDKALGEAPDPVRKALKASKEAERQVAERLQVEITHQKRVDDALAAMHRIDGPAEPALIEKDPEKRAEEKKRAREEACKGHEDTRSCLLWLKIEPVDTELKSIEVEIAKRRRTLGDAELRIQKAESRARPKFDPNNVIMSLVGPFQIQQVVLNWIDYDRDVDKEQVDRCHTCHMGVDSSSYTDASIASQFRTHPHRSTLLAAHPIEKFGCTGCHQGQGRATDALSHSGWHLEEKHGQERWHFAGDHYWEDPLLPVGELSRVEIDDRNDELQIKLGKGKWQTVKFDHRNGPEHAQNAEIEGEYADEAALFGHLQEKIGKVVESEKDIAGKWHAVVRKLDNRIQIGLEQNDPTVHIVAKEVPSFGVKFTDRALADMLGFEAEEVSGKLPLQVASTPPSVPIRADSLPALEKDGRYHPPQGALGLQVPDGMRNRFIEALPEVEAGCLKCHTSDLDLRPRGSDAKNVNAKLEREKAEAQLKANPEAYVKAHGSDELPPVQVLPADLVNPVPTYSEGRALFKKLNCTGCHILDGFPWDRNAGPALDNVTAKVTPKWMLTWIRNPRGWREKTRMPNLWPKPLDPASKRPLPPESPEYEKWLAQMREETVAIASFLTERSDNPAVLPGAPKDAQPLKAQIQGYADVPGATAERGKLVFEAYGCQGCHARGDSDNAVEKLPEPWRSRERDIAPTLANMGEKTTADWIAYWVEEPNRYWHGTKMPNLRLSREEAASVGKYLASLKSTPLNPAQVDEADVALVSDAAKRNERVPCSNAGGALLTRVECGEKLIGYYGCFGCHQVSGFDKSAPVAPELGGFAKKDITTLDFGYAIADHHLQTTETFATLKLDSPRIYRRDRIELKMGDFDLSPQEIRALVVFLKGLVTVKPRPAYDPAAHPAYAAALEGRQIVDDYNCRGCHIIEGRGADIDAYRLSQLSADVQARAPFLTAEGARVQPEWLFTFLREPGAHGIRPWLHPEWAWGNAVPDDKYALRMPTFNLSSEQITAIVRYFASWDGQPYPYQAPKTNELGEEQKLFTLTHMNATDAANCLSCHYQGQFPVERGKTELAKMAPNFNEVSRRLRPEWVKMWLLKPQNFLPYTKMTAFWATVDRPKDSALWPAESDPFLSPPPNWNKIPGFSVATGEQQVEMVRDFLFGLPKDAVFPPAGQEADSPLVKKAPVAEPQAVETADPKGKGATKEKEKKRTGGLRLPARL